MLIDGRSLPTATCLRSRICIVGTGMGALSVAHNLVEAGIEILFIETGSLTASARAAPALQIEEVGHPFRLSRSRGLEVGGGTGLWHGLCAELDEIDFRERAWIPHSGWPIDGADLRQHYAQAWRFLCGGDSSDCFEAAPALPFATPDGLRRKPYRFRSPPFRGKDLVLTWCEEGRARCVMHATGLQLAVDAAGTARRLVAGSGEGRFVVEADAYILAAGALETPRLLLNSQVDAGPRWSDLWWLGRNLIDHPAAYISQLVFRRSVDASLFSGVDAGNGLKTLPGFGIEPEVQEERELPNHAMFIRLGPDGRKRSTAKLMSFLGVRGLRDLRLEHVRALLTDRYVRWRIAHERLQMGARTRYGDLFFMTEQLPNPTSRVDLSEHRRDRYGYPLARVNWQLSDDDIERFDQSLALVMDSLHTQPDVQTTRTDAIDDWRGSVSSAAHHLGTMRMASSPARGAVDTNQKVYGTTNLWVSDGSVFPTAGSVNPSLTICALGHRLSAHLLATALRPPATAPAVPPRQARPGVLATAAAP